VLLVEESKIGEKLYEGVGEMSKGMRGDGRGGERGEGVGRGPGSLSS